MKTMDFMVDSHAGRSGHYIVNAKTRKPLPSLAAACRRRVARRAICRAGRLADQSRSRKTSRTRQMFRDETGFASWQDGMESTPLPATQGHRHLRQQPPDNAREHHRQQPLWLLRDYAAGRPRRRTSPACQSRLDRKDHRTADPTSLDVPSGRVTVRGRAGSLPRPGMKMGEAFRPGQDWPMSCGLSIDRRGSRGARVPMSSRSSC